MRQIFFNILLLIGSSIYAQIGIGTTSPNQNSLLELSRAPYYAIGVN